MLTQLVIGSAAITGSVLLHVLFVIASVVVLDRSGKWFTTGFMELKLVLALVGLTLWMVLGIAATVWMWAALYIQLGVFEDLETALYFSTVSFTTLGLGDITLDKAWRLTSAMMAANGLIIFSLSTAFLMESIRRIGAAQSRFQDRWWRG